MDTQGRLRTVRVLGVTTPLEAGEREVRRAALARAGLREEDLAGARVARRSLDLRARRRGRPPRLVHHVDLILRPGAGSPRLARLLRSGGALEPGEPESLAAPRVRADLVGARAVVVGSGPAGAFAALVLALGGLEVDVLERGARLDRRSKDLVRFRRTRVPNPESNLLFGEGGAGTYSDGKVYTRVDDPLEVPILREFVRAGAPEELVYDARAHIGTDRLHKLLPRFRARLEAEGVRFHFGVRMDGLVVGEGSTGRRVRAVRTTAGELPCDVLVLAPGHSARDTWAMLARHGVPFEAKPFQLGVRIEHPQSLIDAGRYGDVQLARRLGAASYRLTSRGGAAPPAHSFCMCPGGRIVASVNEPGLLCTNGMSDSRHSSRWANAALVTTLGPEHYGGGPFGGVALQRELEQRAFEAGGGDYTAPAQSAADFLAGRLGEEPRRSSFAFGTRPERLDLLLPARVREALRAALVAFDRAIPGFAGPEGLLVGVETRSSGAVRIPRDRRTRLARGFENLLPVGEGAGHAGGITSAALDGARAARAFLEGAAGGSERARWCKPSRGG